MYVLVTYKDEENLLKNEGTRVVTTLYIYILDDQGQLILVVLITEQNEEDPIKN